MSLSALLSIPEEYRAARETAALFHPTGRQLLRVTGPDRVSFVHALLTCDVQKLAEGGACPAALLTAKGGLIADARVWRLPGEVLIETGPGLGQKVFQHLSRHLISEEAELSEAALASVSVLGPRAAEVVEAVIKEAGLMTQPWLVGRPGLDLVVAHERLDGLIERLEAQGAPLGLRRAGEETYEVLRVESGIPRFGAEMDETTLLLEAGLERAVSYQKGCYLGQEVVARATFRGQVQRKLTGLLLGQSSPAPGAALFRGEKKVGRLGSVVHSEALGQRVALGMVHRDSLAAGTVLDLEGAPGTVTVQPLPFA
jgi:folate-binding protein YgfZ